MAKKYLTLEEAAQQLGINRDELNHLREKGDIRGFADRGAWKFRPEDVERLRDSLAAGPSASKADDVLAQLSSGSVLDADDDEMDVSEEPTTVRHRAAEAWADADLTVSERGGALSRDAGALLSRPDSDPEVQLTVESDSDVRLAGAAITEPDSDSDVALVDAALDSDSDVRLAGDAGPMLDSDSDVALTDSDVRLTDEAAPVVDAGSDSDVALVDSDSDVTVAEADSDSDVRLTDEESPLIDIETDSDVQFVSMDSDSDVRLALPHEGTVLDSDSDVALLEDIDETVTFDVPVAGAGVPRDSDDAGTVSLSAGSGISLDRPVDSGISLEDDEDSGITLEDDSGISLDVSEDSGIALEVADSGELTESIPVLDHAEEDHTADTVFEVPSLDGEENVDFDLKESDDTETETSVLLFEDEGSDAETPTLVKPSGAEAEEAEETFEFDVAEEELGEAEEFGEALEAGGEEQEAEELDVFGAEDADFEEAFESGKSTPDFVSPLGAPRAVPAVEVEWGGGVFAGLVVASVFLCVCGALMFDLVRSMWGWQEISAFNSPLLDAIGGLFKK